MLLNCGINIGLKIKKLNAITDLVLLFTAYDNKGIKVRNNGIVQFS